MEESRLTRKQLKKERRKEKKQSLLDSSLQQQKKSASTGDLLGITTPTESNKDGWFNSSFNFF
jgi:hypothetical protein